MADINHKLEAEQSAGHHVRHLIKDAVIIIFSVLIAFALAKTGAVENLLASVKGFNIVGSFLAGVFFTSIFTITPSAVVLLSIARESSLLYVALFGALGAMIGDLLIFKLVRNSLAEDLMSLLKSNPQKKLRALFKVKFFRLSLFFLGGLIIASPLPDELGLMLMGLSKPNNKIFLPTSFIFNFLGILAIGYLAGV